MKFHLAPLSLTGVTWRGQMEVRHISEGRNLETLADTAKLITNDGWGIIYTISFVAINFDPD